VTSAFHAKADTSIRCGSLDRDLHTFLHIHGNGLRKHCIFKVLVQTIKHSKSVVRKDVGVRVSPGAPLIYKGFSRLTRLLSCTLRRLGKHWGSTLAQIRPLSGLSNPKQKFMAFMVRARSRRPASNLSIGLGAPPWGRVQTHVAALMFRHFRTGPIQENRRRGPTNWDSGLRRSQAGMITFIHSPKSASGPTRDRDRDPLFGQG
jgi:hypothetical protein